jgi:hypothetical protein
VPSNTIHVNDSDYNFFFLGGGCLIPTKHLFNFTFFFNVALLSLAFDTEIRRYRRKKENVYLLIVYFQKLIRNFLGHVLAFN